MLKRRTIETTGGRFQTDEANYRRGFEAALQQTRWRLPTPPRSDEAFRRGYERGEAYQQESAGEIRR